MNSEGLTNVVRGLDGRQVQVYKIILEELKSGNHQSNIAEILGWSRSRLNYHVKKLEELGFISPKKSKDPVTGDIKERGFVKPYYLTQEGSKFLDMLEQRLFHRYFLLHNVVFKYPVIVDARMPVDWKRVELSNWVQLVGAVNGVKVRKNTDSLEVFPTNIAGECPYRLLVVALNNANSVVEYLEERLGMMLGRPSLSRKLHFSIKDPIIGNFSRSFELSTEFSKIDESRGFGEIDFLSVDNAYDYLLMPKRVHRNGVLLKKLVKEHETQYLSADPRRLMDKVKFH